MANADIDYVLSQLYQFATDDTLSEEWRAYFLDMHDRLAWGVASLQDAADALTEWTVRGSAYPGDYVGEWED